MLWNKSATSRPCISPQRSRIAAKKHYRYGREQMQMHSRFYGVDFSDPHIEFGGHHLCETLNELGHISCAFYAR
jgi:hypothetical protein